MSFQHLYKPSPTGEGLFYGWFAAMHTRVDVALYGCRSKEEWMNITEEIHREVIRLESIGNYFDEHSELSFVNRNAALRPVVLSDELYEMMAICKEYHTRTLGCFDATISSINHTPDTMNEVHLKADNHTVAYGRPGIVINLSGFLKGYALDKIKGILSANGVTDALVNMGNSSILAMGNHPNGEGWKVTNDCTLYNQCLTTSGNDTDERRHILSPHTGRWVTGKGKVLVVTEKGYVGEIFSTALFAATEEQRICLMRSADSPILFHRFTE